jgi:hypothetical protein
VGFLGWLFGAKAINHPVLGRISRDSSCPRPDFLATYQRLVEDWERIKLRVAKVIFELNQNYFSEEPSRALHSLNDVWDGAELLGIRVAAEGDFSLTYRFDWQAPADGHEITICFENWTPAGCSIDG